MLHKSPTDCVLAVTGRCNSRCLMCDIWKKQDSAELPAEEYVKLPSSLRDINISGGEPFLRPDLTEVARIIAAACPKAHIIISTNGLATDLITEKMKEILLIKPDIGVAVSVDGIGERHDEIRGVPGGFDRAMATVKALKDLGMKNLRLAFTLSEKNIGQLSKVYDLSRQLGVEFTHTRAQSSPFYFGEKKDFGSLCHPESPTKSGTKDLPENKGMFRPAQHDSQTVILSEAKDLPENKGMFRPAQHDSQLKKEYDYIVKSELSTWNIKRWLRAYYAHGMYRFITDKKAPLDNAPGRDFFFMNQKGDIYPSVAHDVLMGNIQNIKYQISNIKNSESFEEFWHSAEVEAAREKAAAQNIPLWMVCTARTAMRRHPLRVGWWIVWNKLSS